MADDSSKGSWWQTMPGILTAIAATVTALSGLIAAVHQSGVFSHRDDSGSRVPLTVSEPSSRNEPATSAGASIVTPSTPSAAIEKPAGTASPGPDPINLLSPDNGGQLMLAPGRNWLVAIDGKEADNAYAYVDAGDEAVFAFKNEQPATISSVGWLIEKSGLNLKQFELLVSDQSSAGPFRSVGKFETQNLRVMTTDGWQDFKFAPTSARYVKIKLLASYEPPTVALYEVRLLGNFKSR